jgi:hypothetical protein
MISRSRYSVDGALALLAVWRRKTANGANPGPAGENFGDKSFVTKGNVGKAKLIEWHCHINFGQMA